VWCSCDDTYPPPFAIMSLFQMSSLSGSS